MIIVIVAIIVIIYLVKSNNDKYEEHNTQTYGENFKYALSQMKLSKIKKNDNADKSYTFTMDEALKYINGDNVSEYVSTKTSSTGAGIVLGDHIGIGLGNAGSKTDIIVTQNDTYISSIQLKSWVEDEVLDAKIDNNEFYFNKHDLDDLIKKIDLAIKPVNRAHKINEYFDDNKPITDYVEDYTLNEILYEINDKTFEDVLEIAIRVRNFKSNKIPVLILLGVAVVLIIFIVIGCRMNVIEF